jgi:hypothetical protein
MISLIEKPRYCIKRTLLALFSDHLLGTHQSAYYTQARLKDTNVFEHLLLIFILYCHKLTFI